MIEFKNQYGPLVRVGNHFVDFNKISNIYYVARDKEFDSFLQVIFAGDCKTIVEKKDIPEFFKRLEEYYAS